MTKITCLSWIIISIIFKLLFDWGSPGFTIGPPFHLFLNCSHHMALLNSATLCLHFSSPDSREYDTWGLIKFPLWQEMFICSCLTDINCWTLVHHLTLNFDKTVQLISLAIPIQDLPVNTDNTAVT